MTSEALLFYAPALFAHSGIEILSRGFYAMGNTKTPVGFAVGSMLINVVLAALLVGPLEVRGLALALSVATVVEFLALYVTIARRVPGLLEPRMTAALTRMALSSAAMAVVAGSVYALLRYGANLDVERGLDALMVVIAAAASGALMYVGVSAALGLEEPRLLLTRLLRFKGRGAT